MNRTLLALVAACLAPMLTLIASTRGIHVVQHGFQSSGFDLQQGRSIFAAKCARCHNVTGSSAAAGPNLSQIGSTAANRKVGMNAAAYVLESILKPREFKAPGTSGEMPVGLVNSYNDEAVRNLMAYVCSLGGHAEDKEILSLAIERPELAENNDVFDSQQVMRGEKLYRGKGNCATCHPFYSGVEYELLAPYIFYRGFRDKAELRKAITKPGDHVPPKYQQTTVLLSNGNAVTGRLISRTESELVMLVREKGVTTCRNIAISEIDTEDDSTLMIQQQLAISDMPSGVDQLLTAEELEDVVQFLLSLN